MATAETRTDEALRVLALFAMQSPDPDCYHAVEEAWAALRAERPPCTASQDGAT